MEWQRSPKIKKSKLQPVPFKYMVGDDFLEVRIPMGLDLTLGPLRIEDVPVLVYWSPSAHSPVITITSFELRDDWASVSTYDITLNRMSISCVLSKFTMPGANDCRMDIDAEGWHWEGAEAFGWALDFRRGHISLAEINEHAVRHGSRIL